ncbi:PASTA domain-containing protein [Peribacillus huizhouensis]|uniref:PASTA domain-containing protein n=1 Tax=Peribacillus huizhouensis TaxID=1501239 RepID=A0ABR6CWM9_9BACI|nr:PASTA domain-containing protein [Peribacillus huizhouensis]MBA9029433.1 hypothetical protein [Peribacillus huizhouensis]
MTSNYPLDISTRFTVEMRDAIRTPRGNDAIHGLVINPQTGDVTNDALAGYLSSIKKDQILELAYCDIIDNKIQQLLLGYTEFQNRFAEISNTLRNIENTLNEVHQRQDGIIELLGYVTVPEWQKKEEVEKGDDMGMVNPSAESLGLRVEYIILQADPRYENEEVVNIEPPPGSLVRKGSTVKVTINLEG